MSNRVNIDFQIIVKKTTIMKKNLTIIFLFLTSCLVGQNITFSSSVKGTKEKDIADVANLWKNYNYACLMDFINRKDSISLKYWNQEEKIFRDIVKHSFSNSFPLYIIGEIFTFDIKKLNEDFYIIRNTLSTSDSTGKNTLAIFNVYAKKDGSDLKLYNYFYLSKTKLSSYSTNKIKYYYPCSYSLDKKLAEKSDSFLTEIQSIYGFSSSKQIIYVLADNMDEGNRLIGFDYTVKSSSLSNSGLFINPNIIVSTRVDHLHELVHSVFMPQFPSGPTLFHEGIATLYGGMNGFSYEFHINELKNILNTTSKIDLSKIDELDTLLNNTTNIFYSVGAAFIDYAYQIGGKEKVLALFKYPNSNKGLTDALKNEFNLELSQVDLFIKKYFETNELKK